MNVEEAFKDFFLECLNDLSDELDKLPQTKRVLFIHSQLRDLKKKEVLSKFEKRRTSKYTTLLKEYLLIEANFLKETRNLPQALLEKSSELKKLPAKKVQGCFGYKSKDITVLEKIFTHLNSQLNGGFVNTHKTNIKTFTEVLTAKDFYSMPGVLYFTCDTRQLRYIIDKMQSYFNALSFENIERSGKFISSRGNLIRANSLSKTKSASPILPKQADKIDKVFKDIL